MSPQTWLLTALMPALALLPEQMRSREAMALLLAIALQESGLRHRRQVNGPAAGFLQFELIGCKGVLEHPASRAHAESFCRELLIVPDPLEVYGAIEYADVLAAGLGRLALWRLPDRLPSLDSDPSVGWTQYLETWRPGKPHRDRWDANWGIAVGAVEAL